MFLRVAKSIRPTASVLFPTSRGLQSSTKFPYEADPQKVIPYEKIPGPKALPVLGVIHHFLPGGQLYNKGLLEQHKLLRDTYGNVVVLKSTMGKPDFVFLFDPKDMEVVFRTEGKWPFRLQLEVLEEFRTKERPDLFQGIGGLLQE